MATGQVWLNIPVADLERSLKFYLNMGFELNMGYPRDAVSACLFLGKNNFVVMLYAIPRFEELVGEPVVLDGAKVLVSYDVDTPAEVDALAQKAMEGGGRLFGPPRALQGWMYGCGFSDPDGHHWNVLFMDFSKMPAK